PASMPLLIYASPSARCQASSPSDRPPASGRKSYWLAGSARSSFTVFSASRSHVVRNISSSFIAIRHLLAHASPPSYPAALPLARQSEAGQSLKPTPAGDGYG